MSFPGLAPPPFFLATPGRPPLQCDQWEQMFNVYLGRPPQHRQCRAPQHSPLRTSAATSDEYALHSRHFGTTFRRRATLSSSVIVFTAAVNTQTSPFMTFLPPYGNYHHTVRFSR
ncbi:hypothetical protein MTO96_040897 [Rhipicephalus appendiculatus]